MADPTDMGGEIHRSFQRRNMSINTLTEFLFDVNNIARLFPSAPPSLRPFIIRGIQNVYADMTKLAPYYPGSLLEIVGMRGFWFFKHFCTAMVVRIAWWLATRVLESEPAPGETLFSRFGSESPAVLWNCLINPFLKFVVQYCDSKHYREYGYILDYGSIIHFDLQGFVTRDLAKHAAGGLWNLKTVSRVLDSNVPSSESANAELKQSCSEGIVDALALTADRYFSAFQLSSTPLIIRMEEDGPSFSVRLAASRSVMPFRWVVTHEQILSWRKRMDKNRTKQRFRFYSKKLNEQVRRERFYDLLRRASNHEDNQDETSGA